MFMKPLNALLTALLFAIANGLFAQAAQELPVAVKPSDAKIKYVGCFDNSNPAGPKCSWSARNVMIKFKGTAANVKMTGKNGDRWQVEMDGKPTKLLQMTGSPVLFELASQFETA